MSKKILMIGIFIGILDASAAITHAYLSARIMPTRIFQYIASGIMGKVAFESLFVPVSLGIAVHFTIAITATFVFYQAYLRLGLSSSPRFLTGAVFGIGLWLFMNYIVIPLSLIGTFPKNPVQIMIGLWIHIFVIGIPMELLVRRVVQKNEVLKMNNP